eukprot:3861103-Pyramimonas_sp.AAC.1
MATRIRQSAGAMVRGAPLRPPPSSLNSRALIARSLARCVWRHDHKLAGVLRCQFPWVQKHCIIQGPSVSLTDPAGFSDVHAHLQRQEAAARRKVVGMLPQKRRRRALALALSDRSALLQGRRNYGTLC